MKEKFEQPTQQAILKIQDSLEETKTQLKQFKAQTNGVQNTNITQAVNSIENAILELGEEPPGMEDDL